MKHSLLLSKVRKSSDKHSTRSQRRRPVKQLTAKLDALADALPELESAALSKSSKDKCGALTATLKSKPGALKKRERIVKEETERFGKNLAILTQTSAKGAGSVDAGSRWAALRKHLENTVGKT